MLPKIKVVSEFEIVEHGVEHPDYFQGCGVSHTKYDEVFTGTGASAYEAANEALDLASHEHAWRKNLLEECENEIAELSERADIPETSDAQYHVSIRIKTEVLVGKPNTNKNCLAGLRCPSCLQFDSLEIDTCGVIEGSSSVSRFTASYNDDGFSNPLCEGDTEFPDDAVARCPECGYRAMLSQFEESPSKS